MLPQLNAVLTQLWDNKSTMLVIGYFLLVHLLRYRRLNQTIKKYNYKTREDYASMTLQEAHSIQLALGEFEFPSVFSKAIFFAIFKTYGIPSISRLLVATGELASDLSASKRAADTSIILTEVVLNPPTSPRTIDGIARMNYLHDRYRKAGKISDDDMLYTLSLFCLEPIRWTNRYEWRHISDLERCAMGMFWKNMGDAMHIPYDVLEQGKMGWTDGLHWLEDLETWSLRYEAAHMLPAESNKRLATVTLDIMLFKLPRVLHGAGKRLIAALLEPRLRRAMMLEEPSSFYSGLVATILTIRKYLLRHVALPRPHLLRHRHIPDHADPATGRYHPMRPIAHPWYIKPTTASRWGPMAWMKWFSGKPLPGDEGDKYYPGGYDIAEIGPVALQGKGQAEMETSRRGIGELNARVGCPFKAW